MKRIMAMMGRIIRALWIAVTVSRRAFGNLLFIAFVLLLAGLFFFGGGKRVSEDVALVLAPVGNIVEQVSEQLLMDLFFGRVTKEETLLNDIIDVVDHAAEDENIKVLVLDQRRMGAAGVSKLHDIGAALNRFRKTGKPIIAAGDYFNQQQYYLAAHANRVYLHPMGQVWLSGYGAYRIYFKTALEKLLVQFHVFRVGTYKSALEPFFRNDMSEEAKEANSAWLNVLWDAYKTDVAVLRKIEADRIDAHINNIGTLLANEGGDAALLALNDGLVDALKTRDEVRDELIQMVGLDDRNKSFKQIDFREYLEIIRPSLRQTEPDHGKVGVIVARGIIMDGKQPVGRIGGDSMAELIRKARDDENIKALVLRINSGGGSALASEIIRREVELTRNAGKPVVVSMSSVAASGGYWMAVAADEIWASPTTITGSIGIFAAMPTFDRTLDSLGIHTDGVGTTRLSGALDITRPLNPLLADMLQHSIEHGYQQFIQRVSEGRNMDPQVVEKIAQGRVWAGKTALELGLVDKLGDLKDAIGSAATMAQLDEYDIVYVEQPLSAKEHLLKKLIRLILSVFGTEHPRERQLVDRFTNFVLDDGDLAILLQLNDPQNLYALCLNCDLN